MTPAKEERPIRPKADGFPCAPLVEALLDIQFDTPLNDDEMAAAQEALRPVYPSFTGIPHLELSFDIEQEALDVAQREVRYRGDGADPTEVVLLQPNGMATSQLTPYRDWNALFGRFVRDLETVEKTTRNRNPRRIAVRSINRIDVPPHGRAVRYEDYFALYPHLPRGLDPIADFGMQIVLNVPEIDAVAKIAVSGTPPAVEGMASFLLDIDLFRTANLPADRSELYGLFAAFRKAKNDLYRTCLTPQALREFEE